MQFKLIDQNNENDENKEENKENINKSGYYKDWKEWSCIPCLNKSVNCVILGSCSWALLLFIIILISVNIKLVSSMNECKYNKIDILVLANVSAINNGFITYNFDNIDCTIKIFNNYAPINTMVYIYRSNSGYCDNNKYKNRCESDLIMFNVMFIVSGMIVLFFICLGIWTIKTPNEN